MPPFVPSYNAVLHTRAVLHCRLGLPNELVLDILHRARYWVEDVRDFNEHTVLRNREFSDEFSTAYPCLALPFKSNWPLYKTKNLRGIEFLIVSHDQGGWAPESIRGTSDTCSWFEVSNLRSTRRPKSGTHDSILEKLGGRRNVGRFIRLTTSTRLWRTGMVSPEPSSSPALHRRWNRRGCIAAQCIQCCTPQIKSHWASRASTPGIFRAMKLQEDLRSSKANMLEDTA